MTLQTGNLRRAVKGAVASGAMAVGLLMGIGSTTANADILDDVGVKYMQGAGGGQISNFVKEALTLRALGFKPSKGNLEDLQAGWDHLPNQKWLVDALKDTVAYQRKLQAQMQNANNPSQPGYNMGQTPLPPGVPPDPGNPNNTGIALIPGTGITEPIG
jgi:hypothetical protein